MHVGWCENQRLIKKAPRSYIFHQSPQHFTLSTPYFAVGGAVDPVSVGSRCTQPPPPQPSQFSTACLLHTTTSTSVSTLSADRKQLHCCSVCVTRGGTCICVRLGARWAFISMEAQSVCFVNKAQGECLLYLTYDTIWIDKKTARSGRAPLGCGARGNAISFWCSCSAKQTLRAMPPG